MGKLIVLVGPKGSGKAEWAANWLKAQPKEGPKRSVDKAFDRAVFHLSQGHDVALDANLLQMIVDHAGRDDQDKSNFEVLSFA